MTSHLHAQNKNLRTKKFLVGGEKNPNLVECWPVAICINKSTDAFPRLGLKIFTNLVPCQLWMAPITKNKKIGVRLIKESRCLLSFISVVCHCDNPLRSESEIGIHNKDRHNHSQANKTGCHHIDNQRLFKHDPGVAGAQCVDACKGC